MAVPDNLPQLAKRLHDLYCAKTGFDLLYNLNRELAWAEWLRYSQYTWTETDLGLTIAYLIHEIGEKRKGREGRNEGCLKFHNLVGQPDMFEQDLASAKLWRKPAKPAPAQPTATKPEPTRPDDVVSPAEAAVMFRNLPRF